MKKNSRSLSMICMSILMVLAESCTIYKAYQKNPRRVGEVVPCSSRVAKKLTELIRPEYSPKRILEVGAGSGAMTSKIITKMNENDHLDLVEIEPILCDVLKEKFGHVKNVSIHCTDFLQWHPKDKYDYVISTLPFNSFPHDLVQKLIDHLIDVSKDGANLSFVELKWLSSFRKIAMNKAEKEKFQKTLDTAGNFYKKYALYDTNVYMNFPPIIIYHLKIDKSK
jgi:phosphatidylethanolamine/phosphatidyl-N-methylethanolamine N-methyltransferase